MKLHFRLHRIRISNFTGIRGVEYIGDMREIQVARYRPKMSNIHIVNIYRYRYYVNLKKL